MDEENERLKQEVQSDEQVEDLLAEDEENANISVNAEQDRLMAMMTSMHDKMNSFLTRLSRVEAAHVRPAGKKQRLAARSENLEDENNASDSEVLADGTNNNGKAPATSNTSAAENELLSETAQDYAEEAQTSDDVSQQLADIVNQRWSSKLDESKLKDKILKYDRQKIVRISEFPENACQGWDGFNPINRNSAIDAS